MPWTLHPAYHRLGLRDMWPGLASARPPKRPAPDPDVQPWVWIEHPDGEGMGIPQAKAEEGLRKALDAWWRETF